MKKMKIGSLLLLAVMVIPLMVSCGGDGDGDDGGSSITVNLTTTDKTDDGFFDGMMYYKITSNSPTEVTVFKVDNSVVKVEIPAYVKIDGTTYKCTSISEKAFYQCKSLSSISIPNSVINIGKSAFEGCTGLKKVIVKNLKAWFGIEFNNGYSNPLLYAHHLYSDENTEITELVIPDGVTAIGDYALSDCSGLNSITIPNSITSIGRWAFYRCSSLTSVTIPNSVTSIGNNAFSNCGGLTSITIPNSVTSIGGSAFEGCTGLTSVTIGNGVTSIGNYAFHGCSGLKKVIIKDLTAWCKIEFGSYNSSNPLYYAHHLYSDENTEITDLVIPNSVTIIGNCVFSGCSGLTSVTIPYSVTSIGGSAFSGCSGLTSVTIPYSVTSIGNWTFCDCNSLTSVTIGLGVTSIGDYAFYGCSDLTSVRCKAQTPPNISYDTFSDLYSKATLFIPKGTLNAYKKTDSWKNFQNIIEE